VPAVDRDPASTFSEPAKLSKSAWSPCCMASISFRLHVPRNPRFAGTSGWAITTTHAASARGSSVCLVTKLVTKNSTQPIAHVLGGSQQRNTRLR